jgi:hypothetical protein
VTHQRVAWTLSIFMLFAISGNGQSQSRPKFPAPPVGTESNPGATDADETQRMTREMAKKANLERHALLKTDTDRLLKLAVELKDYVDKSNENVLSLEVLKKAEAIEKLAHSVKDKMKGPN